MSNHDAEADISSDSRVGPEWDALDEVDLQSAVSGLAQMVASSRGMDGLLTDVAGFAARAIPDVDGAAVTVLRPESGRQHVQSWAATAEFVREIDALQYEVLQEGPCLSCMQTRRPIVSASLGGDARWPRFGSRVAGLGVHSALSLPLLIEGQVIGAINCFAYGRNAFGEHAVRLGELFAVPAAVSVHNAQLLAGARDKVDQLQRALVSRTVIDQAIGILRSRHGGSAEEAFDRLRRTSQAENVKLAVIAQRLVDESVQSALLRPHPS